MQTRFRLPFLFCAAAMLLLASCSKTNKQGRLVPKNALLVIHLNGESLNAKLPWDEIKKNEAFAQAYADSTLPPFVKSLLDNPDNSGIDTKKDLIFFMSKDSLGGYMSIEGSIKDAAKFKILNDTILKGTGTASEKDGISYMSKAPACVGWNKEKFIYVIDMPQMDYMSGGGMMGGSKYSEKMPRDIGLTCKNVFDLKEDNSLAKDEKFTSLMNEKGDVHFWFNSSELMAGNMAMGILGLTKIGDLLKDNLSTGTLSFEDGKILFKGKGYAGKDLAALFKKYNGDGISEDMIKRFPGKNVAGVLAFNFKPEGIKELIKLTGLDGMANIGLAKAGVDFTVDDFIKANKGDLFFGVSDITMKSDTVRYGAGPEQYFASNKPTANYIFAASINDKAAFNNLIKAGQKFDSDMRSYDDSGIVSKPPFSYSSNDKYFALGANKEAVDQYLAGGSNDFDFLKKLSGYPIAGYANIQTIMKAFEKELTKDSTGKLMYDASLQVWQDIYMTGGKWDDGGMTSQLEINFVDKTTNSLKQLNSYFAKMAKIHQDEKKKNEARIVSSDSFPPPPQIDPAVVSPKRK